MTITRTQRPTRRRHLRVILMIIAAGVATPVAAQLDTRAFEAFLSSLRNPGAQYVVVSNHFRHDVGCTSTGCILMGPMDDLESCQDWSRAYNSADPYDHTRCVEASDYDSLRY